MYLTITEWCQLDMLQVGTVQCQGRQTQQGFPGPSAQLTLPWYLVETLAAYSSHASRRVHSVFSQKLGLLSLLVPESLELCNGYRGKRDGKLK